MLISPGGFLLIEIEIVPFFRITRLLEDEVEQDEAFWSQEALKDVGRRRSPLVLFFRSLLRRFGVAAAATGGLA
jgi:hypothetical protein